MTQSLALDAEISQIRQWLKENNRESQTSRKFQDDILQFVLDNCASGTALMEVGCFRGGFTAQLALIAKQLELRLDVVDIDHQYLNIAIDTVTQSGLEQFADFHAMSLPDFILNNPTLPKYVLVFVDGDHRYDGVVSDIRAIKSFTPTASACAFHDFSLRYSDESLKDVRVDKAITDEFGSDATLVRIGEVAGLGSTLRTEPGDDRHFHQRGEPEGVLIRLE